MLHKFIVYNLAALPYFNQVKFSICKSTQKFGHIFTITAELHRGLSHTMMKVNLNAIKLGKFFQINYGFRHVPKNFNMIYYIFSRNQELNFKKYVTCEP